MVCGVAKAGLRRYHSPGEGGNGKMSQMTRRLFYCAGALVLFTGCAAQNSSDQAATPAGQAATSPGQTASSPVEYDASRVAGGFDQVRELPPGEPVPRTADGHPDLSGRYYPNRAGRMLQGGYQIDDSIMNHVAPGATREEPAVFTAEGEKYKNPPFPYGSCPVGGTPISITMQSSEHGPMELIQQQRKVWILTEFQQTIRLIPTDGRPHSTDPDPSFTGESVGRWEGDTLVVDTIGVDRRLMNFERWHPSDKQHIVERFTRTSKNYLTYDLMIEDPVVLAKPYIHAPRIWTLAQNPNDLWTEYICTANEEPVYMQKMDPTKRQEIESGTGRGGRGRGSAQ
jgi:hypothetical protein